jgi:hypothetical protein
MRKNALTVVVLLSLTSVAFIVAACASSGGGGSEAGGGGEAGAVGELGPSTVVQQAGGRVLMCPDLGFSRLFMCMPNWDLERCGYDFLGSIRAERTGVGQDTKEVAEQFHREAMRLKADAVFNVQQETRPGSWVWRLSGTAVRLKDPSCRAGG